MQNTRSQIRCLLFTREVDGQGRKVYLPVGEQQTNETKGDGSIWRLRIGNTSVDEKALVLMGGGSVVGDVPRGIPVLGVPKLDVGMLFKLLPIAAIISLLGFMEAISIAKAMAAKTGQRLDPNQELIGQMEGKNVIKDDIFSTAVKWNAQP